MINFFDDIKPKKKKATASTYDPVAEMKELSTKGLLFDNNRTPIDLVKSVSQKTGINPSLLYSSAFQEGMNKAIARPDEISEAYLTANVGNEYPVDGFYNYGLDTFAEKFPKYVEKGYLPEDFATNFHEYEAENELHQPIRTAAFKNNATALMAKSAMLRDIQDTVYEYAKTKNIELDDSAKQYFTLAAYNSGEGNAMKMMEKYSKAKDKKAFIEKGDSEWQKVHTNISPRMKSMTAASEYFKE